jgi:hypothetical protein
VEYEVELFHAPANADEKPVWRQRTRAPHLEYPAARPALERGGNYRWRATVVGKGPVTEGRFRVASREEDRDLLSIRQLAGSKSPSERLFAAMLFEARRFHGESGPLFEALVKELPDEPWVVLAWARHLGRVGRSDEARHLEKKALDLASKSR